MKMNIVLMLLGVVIFAVGAVMTFSCNKDKNKAESETLQQTCTNDRSDLNKHEFNSDGKPLNDEPVTASAETDSKKKGNDFEDFVANILNYNSLTIKEWNKGTVTNEGAFAENALNPDMFVSDPETNINLEYWIECKFRSDLDNGEFKLKDYQTERYSDIQKSSKRKILIALGVGGNASNPEKFYIIPLDSIKRFKHIPDKYLSHYIVVDPKQNIKSHIRNYFFNDVFKKGKK